MTGNRDWVSNILVLICRAFCRSPTHNRLFRVSLYLCLIIDRSIIFIHPRSIMSTPASSSSSSDGSNKHAKVRIMVVLVGLVVWQILTQQGSLLPQENPNVTCRTTHTTVVTDVGTEETVNVLLALSGNHTGFLGEFQVALKSILLNAPIDASMTVHIIGDNDAYQALGNIFIESTQFFHNLTSILTPPKNHYINAPTNNLYTTTWSSRHPINIRTYNVEDRLDGWRTKIRNLWYEKQNKIDQYLILC